MDRMGNTSRRWLRRLGVGGVLSAIGLLMFAAPAGAATFCVNKLGPQCTQIFNVDGLDAAIDAAITNGQGSPDRIEIGPGLYGEGPYLAISQVEIVGAGAGQTILTNATPLFDSAVLLANFGTPTVSDLTVRVGAGTAPKGIQIALGSLERVAIEAGTGYTAGTGLDIVGSTVRNVMVTLPSGGAVSASGADITDATFSTPIGGFLQGGVARRIRFSGGITVAGSQRIEDSVIRAPGGGIRAVQTTQFSSASAVLSHVTIVGDGSAGSEGIHHVSGSGAFAALTSSLTLRNVAIRGFQTDLVRGGFAGIPNPCGVSCPITANLTVEHSLLDFPEKVSDLGGPGTLTLGPGNVDGLDPRFVDQATGDLRPRFDSPLLDVGDPAGLGAAPNYLNESPLDAGGFLRIAAASGGVAPRRDIGAFEYQRLAPTIGLTPPAGTVFLYRPANFTTTSRDPDGDAVTVAIAADGKATTGATRQIAFTTLGGHTVSATATDPTGLQALASPLTVTVVAKSGACANRRDGTKGRDVFNGTRAGERLVGGRGNDRLSGARGDDCLTGGLGNDVLIGGPGRDRFDAGPGNDVINARDGKREIVACGAGRDRVVADRSDRLAGCESVRF